MTDPIVVRSVTVNEVMAGDGSLRLQVSTEGEPTMWQQLGMLEAAQVGLRSDLAACWAPIDSDDDGDEE